VAESPTSTPTSAAGFDSSFDYEVERNHWKIEMAHRIRIRASKILFEQPREAHGLHIFAAILEREWLEGPHDCSHGAPRRRSTLPSSTFS